jgi:hypothetical protein
MLAVEFSETGRESYAALFTELRESILLALRRRKSVRIEDNQTIEPLLMSVTGSKLPSKYVSGVCYRYTENAFDFKQGSAGFKLFIASNFDNRVV